jgi:predicted enzyme related to lactoylglutathione lyase
MISRDFLMFMTVLLDMGWEAGYYRKMNSEFNFAHVNLVAKDWRKLAGFYVDVFGCEPVPPERSLSGGWLDDATGIKNAEINGVHLKLPGFTDSPPTLEIFQYNSSPDRAGKAINNCGFGHIAFCVNDVGAALRKLLDHGGGVMGKTVVKKINGAGTVTFVYARDPEGNFIELQNWEKE